MFKPSVYKERRNKLRALIRGGIVFLPGNTESPVNYPANTYKFRQDSSFLYFFGIPLPDLYGIIDIDSGKDIIFGNDIDIEDIIWMGNQPSVKELASGCDVKKTDPVSRLEEYLAGCKKKKRNIHFLPQYRAENKIQMGKLLGISTGELNNNASADLIRSVVTLRSVKDDDEIAHLYKIMEVGYMMHTTAMKMGGMAGIYESEIAGVVEGIALSEGGSVSFPVILSKHGETLHNHCHANKLKKGDLVLCDAGYESELGYATDHTRTFPVGGKFSVIQKDIYVIVLEALNSAIKAIRPGVMYRDIHFLAAEIITKGLKDLKLMKGDTAESVKAGAHALFFPHGIGHMLGLDVHDMENYGENYVGYDSNVTRSKQFGTAFLRMARKLQPGFVVTVEPGIYFIPALIDKWKKEKINNGFINFDKVEKYRNFGGIRLEDDVLVTSNGYKILGKKRIPVSVADVEKTVLSADVT